MTLPTLAPGSGKTQKAWLGVLLGQTQGSKMRKVQGILRIAAHERNHQADLAKAQIARTSALTEDC